MPTATLTSIASSARTSSMVVTPPAAVTSRERRRAQPAEPIEIRALHHAFLIDIRAQKARTVRFERAEHVLGGKRSRFAPAFDHDAPVFRIERDHDAVAADGGAQCGEEGAR